MIFRQTKTIFIYDILIIILMDSSEINSESADQLNESSIIRKHVEPTVAEKLKKPEC
jgi:hypothetical protein